MIAGHIPSFKLSVACNRCRSVPLVKNNYLFKPVVNLTPEDVVTTTTQDFWNGIFLNLSFLWRLLLTIIYIRVRWFRISHNLSQTLDGQNGWGKRVISSLHLLRWSSWSRPMSCPLLSTSTWPPLYGNAVTISNFLDVSSPCVNSPTVQLWRHNR